MVEATVLVKGKVENLGVQFKMLSQSKVLCLPLNLTTLLHFECTLFLEIFLVKCFPISRLWLRQNKKRRVSDVVRPGFKLQVHCGVAALQWKHSSRCCREPICVPSSLEELFTRPIYPLWAPVEIFSLLVSKCFHTRVISQMLSVSILPPQRGVLSLWQREAKWW